MITGSEAKCSFEMRAYHMLKVDEAERPLPYDDKTGKTVVLPTGGNITIGVGRNLTGKGLSQKEILYLFNNDLEEALEIARRIFPSFDCYSENRRLGLVNLIFNMGEGNSVRGFRSFENTIEAIKDENWSRAVANLKNSLWFTQVGNRAPRVCALLEDRYEY